MLGGGLRKAPRRVLLATNYGTATRFAKQIVRTDNSPDLHSYLRFDVQGLTGNVTSATLRIYANSSSSAGYTVYSVSDNTWAETGITYSNAPAFGSSLGSSGTFSANAWTTVDVTAYITGNGVYNLAFSTTSSTNVSYSSREGANAPQLVIQTSSGPTNTPTFTPTTGPTPTRTNTPGPTATNTLTATPAPPFSNATFVYDGDGERVKSTINGTITTYFVGAHYEVSGSTITKYYYAGAQRIAMRTNGALNYLLGDHLGSTSLTTNVSGQVVSELRYKAWGEVRYASGNAPTKYQYTGQFSYESEFGLYYYGARWYDDSLGRFAQADTIIPEQSQGVQAWDRYGYVNNNPLRYSDPTGHMRTEDSEGKRGCSNQYYCRAGRPKYPTEYTQGRAPKRPQPSVKAPQGSIYASLYVIPDTVFHDAQLATKAEETYTGWTGSGDGDMPFLYDLSDAITSISSDLNNSSPDLYRIGIRIDWHGNGLGVTIDNIQVSNHSPTYVILNGVQVRTDPLGANDLVIRGPAEGVGINGDQPCIINMTVNNALPPHLNSILTVQLDSNGGFPPHPYVRIGFPSGVYPLGGCSFPVTIK